MTAVLLAAAGLLAACEKPTPVVTVSSGSNSRSGGAICWTRDATPLGQGSCDLTRASADALVVAPDAQMGTPVGIDVTSAVAEHGWVASVNGQQLTNISHELYGRIVVPGNAFLGNEQRGLITISSASEDGKGVRGAWAFVIKAR
jgi:hypothetical protein